MADVGLLRQTSGGDAAAIGPTAATSGWKVGQISNGERLRSAVIVPRRGILEGTVSRRSDEISMRPDSTNSIAAGVAISRVLSLR